MENFWTSKKPINGLRHFVLVNKMNENNQIMFLLVSVIDIEVNLKITYKDLFQSGKWEKGWVNLPKIESITKDYSKYKSTLLEKKKVNKIVLNDASIFNIS